MRRREPVGLASIVAAVLLWAATSSAPAGAACGFKDAVVKGMVVELGGAPVEGATVLIFIDDDRNPLFDRGTEQDSARTDAEGRFEFEGSFYDDAERPWWRVWSTGIDYCGREPETFILIVQHEGFFARRTIVTPKNAKIRRTTAREYLVELEEPIELLAKRGGA